MIGIYLSALALVALGFLGGFVAGWWWRGKVIVRKIDRQVGRIVDRLFRPAPPAPPGPGRRTDADIIPFPEQKP